MMNTGIKLLPELILKTKLNRRKKTSRSGGFLCVFKLFLCLKGVFTCAADGAGKIFGKVFELGAGGDAVIGIAYSLVVFITAY